MRVAVIGGGAWGTALAALARRGGAAVSLWARDDAVVEAINSGRGNPDYLPGVDLPAGIRATGDLAEAAAQADAVLLVTPAQAVRATAAAMAAALPAGVPVAICAKGIERGSLLLMSEVMAEVAPDTPVAAASGPTFAGEVARGLPAAITIAAEDEAVAELFVEALGQPSFRPYVSDDIVGVQLGGAVKNVIAIACGVVVGRGMGESARAALVTRGLAEIARLAAACGGRPETTMGLAGLGDLVLTCGSRQSRNMSLGAALGEGRTLDAILAGRRSVAEGVQTTAAAVGLAARRGVDMPIVSAVDSILEGAAVDDVVAELMARPFRHE